MNHIYRVVYNAATNTYQAVPENSTGKHKTASEKSSCAVSDVSEKGAFFALKPMALCAMAMGLSSTGAWAAPTGGHISAGDASIAQHGKITNIQQNSQKAAINWQTFGIKADETVNFKQPNAQAVILNRVIGNEKSVIDGAMNANGKVFISNPNGMIIGKNAQINVGALLATTAKIKNQDFMNGLFKFDQATGDITQLGDIKVPTGGVVALIAPIVANKGNITAPQGKVLLASAEQFSITLPDNGQFAYTLDRGTLQGLVDNGGAILADGGHVILTAKGTDAVKKSLIKHTGKIEANTVQNKNGVIELLGDLDNTRLEASGSLKAEAKEKGDGGFIETSAAKVSIRDLSVSTKSKFGKTGAWLIDPQDFNINAGSGEHTETSIGADTLSQNLQATDITISTDSNGSEKGDIYVNAPVSWDNNRLTLSAHNNIYINENLNGSGNARLELKYGQASENAIQADGTESDYYIQKGKKIDLPTGQNLVVQRGSSSDNARRLTVLHSLPNDGRLFPKYVALGTDLNLSGQPFTQGLNGVELFHGLGHEIDGLEIDHTQNMSGQSPEHIGFIPNLSGGIRDLTLNNVNIKAQINDDCDGNCNEPIGVGALIGRAGDATIKNVYVSGKMSDLGNYGNVKMGGLIGIADGRVRVINSHTDVNIEKQEQTQANELVGLDNGGLSVENSQGTGNITNIEPTQPVTPIQPVNPPAPTTPPTPTQPANPTPPVTQPLQPVPTPQPTTQPVIPAQPAPTTPPTPTQPANPTITAPAQPTQPSNPIVPNTPTVPTNPTQPVNPTTTAPVQPTQPNNPAVPNTPTVPINPTYSKLMELKHPISQEQREIQTRIDEEKPKIYAIDTEKLEITPVSDKDKELLKKLEKFIFENNYLEISNTLVEFSKETVEALPYLLSKRSFAQLQIINSRLSQDLVRINNGVLENADEIDDLLTRSDNLMGGGSWGQASKLGKAVKGFDAIMKVKTLADTARKILATEQAYRDGVSKGHNIDLITNSTDYLGWKVPVVGAGMAVWKSAIAVNELIAGDTLAGALDRQLTDAKTTMDNFSLSMDIIARQLAEGKITKKQALEQYNKFSSNALEQLGSINDLLLITDDTPILDKIGKITVIAAIGLTSNTANLERVSNAVSDGMGAISQYRFKHILQKAELQRIANGNLSEIQ